MNSSVTTFIHNFLESFDQAPLGKHLASLFDRFTSHSWNDITTLWILLQIVSLWIILNYSFRFFKKEFRDIPDYHVEIPKSTGRFLQPNQKCIDTSEITCYDPATFEILGISKVISEKEVKEIVSSASKAQKQWAKTSFSERRRVLRILLNFIVKNQDTINNISIKETGKTAIDSAFGEVFMSCEKIQYIIKNGERFLKRDYRHTGMLMFHKLAYVDYVPCGVIGLIIPWNFPVHNVLSHVTTALMAGNAVVVKVSEWASWSADFLEKLLQGALIAAGYSGSLVRCVTGTAECGSALVQSVNKLLFIGSPLVGRLVMSAAAKTLTPITLELGGKDPFIVCEDANLEYVTNMALRGAFMNCGQNCLSAERFYIFDGIYDRFMDRVLKILPTIRQGPHEPDMGAINLPSQLDKYKELIQDAILKGAKLLTGGKVNVNFKNGHFFEPTVLVNVNHSMRIMREEIFGPVMCVIRVQTDEEVVRLANDCDYGLSCSIFSSNYKRAHRIAEQIVTGSTIINDWGVSMLIQSMPFGGVKLSGFGKFNGPEGIRDFTFQKNCVTDRFGFILPPPSVLMYPTSSKVHTLVVDFITILYGRGLLGKVRAIGSLFWKLLRRDF